MDDTKTYLEDLARRVARDLMAAYSGAVPEHGAVFPARRGGGVRVSEQESRLLFLDHLRRDRRYGFAIETPTRETYRQSGATPMSARMDLTLFGSSREPLVHIELKAHNCGVESIRKDLEKLLRERVTGAWFHTLEHANAGTLNALAGKFGEAFGLLPEPLAVSRGALLLAVCVLDPGVLHARWIVFSGSLEANLAAIDEALAAFRGAPARYKAGETRNGGKGVREGYYVLAPQLAPGTFLHLSIRGGSYSLRDFSGPTPRVFKVPGLATGADLRASGLLTRTAPVTAEDLRHSLEMEPEYWRARIREMNAAV